MFRGSVAAGSKDAKSLLSRRQTFGVGVCVYVVCCAPQRYHDSHATVSAVTSAQVEHREQAPVVLAPASVMDSLTRDLSTGREETRHGFVETLQMSPSRFVLP